MSKTNNLDYMEYEYNTEDYQDGITDMSYTCGLISALVDTGIPAETALTYILEMMTTQETIAKELEIVKLQTQASIDIAKYESISK